MARILVTFDVSIVIGWLTYNYIAPASLFDFEQVLIFI